MERPVSPPIGPTKQEIYELKDREARFRTDTETFAQRCREEINKIKKILATATTVDQILPIAQAVRELIPKIEEARKIIPRVAPLQQPVLKGNEDQVTKLKLSVMVRVREFESILDGITVVLSARASFETLLELSGVISSSFSILSHCMQLAIKNNINGSLMHVT